ncbi:hypothetical protein GF324_09565, partial [bacterium]|nr:hypothetical protein [bacterium]
MAEGNSDERAAQLYDEIFESFSLEFEESGDRFPGTQAEIREARKKLEEARAQNPSDPSIIDSLNNLEQTLDEAESRQFAGSWWMIGVLGIFILVMFYMTGLQPLFEEVTLDRAGRSLKARVESLNNSIARYETIIDTAQAKDT